MRQPMSCVSGACLATLLFAAGALAQPAQFEGWKEDRPLVAPTRACGALRALSGYEFAIDIAESVPAQAAAPAFCRVQGLIQPEIRFEVSLPVAWNGRLYMFGNGGFAGEPLAAGFRAGRRNLAVTKGFVAAQTNTGHDGTREPLATFAATPQKLSDYAYRAVHVTALAAKTLARAYYGSAPAFSYFDGCSTGGRQGLIAAQRFPDDFDGISVGAPVLDFTGTMAHYVGVTRALQAGPVSEAKVKVLADATYARCDSADGVADGLITDPRTCGFDPDRDVPRCPPGAAGDTCLTAAEVASVKVLLGDLVVGGRRRFPGFPIGAEAAGPTPNGPRTGWDPWIIRTGQPTIAFSFMESFFKHMATPGAEIDWKTFDAERDMATLDAIGTLLNATDPDLSAFRSRKGRILMWYGWADPALNPRMGLEYYERVSETMGKGTPEFFRLFMMPGVFHCSGGVGPDRLDTMTPLVAWVERGAAPDRLVASQRAGDKTTRTRPLCPHPQVATYKGQGSADMAESFVCAVPAGSGGSAGATRP
jgi:feruloyl esterase